MNFGQAYQWLHGDRVEYSGCRAAAEALKEEIELLRQDSKRYRWLKWSAVADVRIVGVGKRSGVELDNSIDSQMMESKVE